MPPLSSAPIFHSPVEGTKRPKDMRKHGLRYKKNMLKIREEQRHLRKKAHIHGLPHILWKVCSLCLFKSGNYWWACYFQRVAWNFPGLKLHSFSQGDGSSLWDWPTSNNQCAAAQPPFLSLQLYRTLLVPPLVPVKTRAMTAPALHSGFLLPSFAVSAAGMGKASPWPSWGTAKQGN